MLLVAMSERRDATLRYVVCCLSRRAGTAPFLQVSRRPRRLANYAHGGKYSGRLRHATPRAASSLSLFLCLPVSPALCLPFLRLSLKFTALRHFICCRWSRKQSRRFGCVAGWVQLLRSGRKYFRNVTKQQIDKKKRREIE